MFKKLLEIKSCGDDNVSSNSSFDLIGYNNCITHIGLPKPYEAIIAKFTANNFENETKFSKAIYRASKMVCEELNHKHSDKANNIMQKDYTITGPVSYGKIERTFNPPAEKPPKTDLHSGMHSSYRETTYFIIGVISFIIILIISIFLFRKRANRDAISVEQVSKNDAERIRPAFISETKRYPNVYPAPMNPVSNGSAPPSYHEVRSGYSNTSPTSFK